MSDVARFLDDLGLGAHIEAFHDNEIAFQDLLDLSDADLRELGLPMGPRKRLLRAIAAQAEVNTDTESPALPTEAERRQLTVLFSDLVGSTALSRQLDPEDLRDVMRRYQDAVAGAIARYDGYLAKFLGDGVLAYFGWPEAFEDQAERAVRAGLDVVGAVAEISLGDGERLQARVGIATGHVVVGDLVGMSTADAQAVTGETPNLAARLQGLAEPGQVVVDSVSHRLVNATFEAATMGEQTIKGFAEPVEAWRVTGETGAESRFEALHGEGLTSLIGRAHELGLMRERWAQAKGAEGQVLLLSGEAGIGKSRLVRALREDVSAEPHFRLRYQCSPHHTKSALFPIIQRLEKAAGFEAEDSVSAKLDKLEDLLRLATPDTEAAAPLFATLLSLPAEERYGVLDMTPQQRRDRVIEALVTQVLQLSERRPILFVLEDAHWIDSTTELLVSEIIARIAEKAVFLVLTHRPDYAPPWADHPHVTAVALNRLSKAQGMEIAQSVGGGELPSKTVERIIARADGVPLYVEELTKTLVEAGADDDDAIPESLQASMTARLDRLGEAKKMAQIGAVIGRDFRHPLVVALSGLIEQEAKQALQRLVESGLLFQQGTPPDAAYQFKHALVQDTAYDSLLRRRRRELHADLAKFLTEKFPSTAEFEPELLAHHWQQGGDVEMAARYRVLAAERADNLSAPWEAVAHYLQAVALIEDMTDTVEVRRWFLDIVLALISVRGSFWSHAEEQARYLLYIDKALDTARGLAELAAIARLEAFKSIYWPDQKLLADALAHAEASGDEATQAQVAMTTSGYLGFVGRFEQSLANIDRAIEIFTRLGDYASLGITLAGVGRCFNARAGRLDYSFELAGRARQMADQSDNLNFKSWLAMEAEPNMYKGDWRRVIEVVEEGIPIAWEIGNWFVAVYACSWAALAYLKQGRMPDARRTIDKGFECLEKAASYHPAVTYMHTVRGSVLLAEDNIAEARADVDWACERADQRSLLLELGAAHRVLGEINAAAGDTVAADTSFRQSLDVLGKIQSQPELAQTLLAYGRFQHKIDREESTRLLNRALALFEAIGADGWAVETMAAFRN